MAAAIYTPNNLTSKDTKHVQVESQGKITSPWQCPRWSPGADSCFNSVWTEQTQGRPFFQPPATLQPLLQSLPLEPPQPSSASESSQHRFFELKSLLLSNHEPRNLSELFHCGGGHYQPPGQTASVGLLTYLSQDSCFPQDDMALQGMGHFFHELAWPSVS